MKKIAILTIAAALLGLLLGCSLTPSAGDTGSLVLTFVQSGVKGAKTFLPPVDMNIASYDVQGSGPGGASFQQTGITAATLTVGSLVTGNWSISVDAWNGAATPVKIAAGSVGVTITGGQTAAANVVVSPLAGNGGMTLTVSWPAGKVTSPSVVATVTPQGGVPWNFALTMAGDNLSASGSYSPCPGGYYTLSVSLKDGAQVVAGMTDVVRVLAGTTTNATVTFVATDIVQGVGGLNLAVTPDLQNPIDITFTGQQAVLAQGSNMTVTASPSVAVDSYQWYLDGAALTGATGAAVTTGSALSTGPFRLDVVVSKGNVLSAAGVSFRVQQVVAAPSFSPAGGTYTSDQLVSLACATAGATIHYTTDGLTIPTSASPAYLSPIAVSGAGTTLTIKAIAVKAGMIDSPVASATYTITYTANIANKPSIGDYLVDGRGMTLYWTSSDAPNFSNLPDETLTSWPVFYVSNTQVPAPLNPSDFGTYTRDNGMPQTTYKGYPLYHSILDTAPGNTNGNNLGNWFVVAP